MFCVFLWCFVVVFVIFFIIIVGTILIFLCVCVSAHADAGKSEMMLSYFNKFYIYKTKDSQPSTINYCSGVIFIFQTSISLTFLPRSAYIQSPLVAFFFILSFCFCCFYASAGLYLFSITFAASIFVYVVFSSIFHTQKKNKVK